MIPSAGRILIVDDSENNLMFVDHALREQGYTVVDAHDGVDALDMFEKYQPDLVVTDLLMPRLSGFVVCQRIKQNQRTQSIPVIAMSGLTDQSDKVRALELGADCFLYKPIDHLELITAVRTLLKARQCQTRIDQLAKTSRGEISQVVQNLEQASAHLQAHPDAALGLLVEQALAACKRLDQQFK